jgi:hypothetical protein
MPAAGINDPGYSYSTQFGLSVVHARLSPSEEERMKVRDC